MKFLNSIHVSLPDLSLFKVPPHQDPITLPSPQAGSSLHAPFYTIPASVYNAALDVKIPITVACLYLVTVTSLNAYNRSHGNKPWAISKTKGFFIFVVIHNILLAVYSGWTFLGMWGALSRSVENPTGPDGLVGTIDSLCKIQGPGGIGNAVTYQPSISSWVSQSPGSVFLSDVGTPDPTDLGRLWNEGLAFYGWFFYLSKFYEVLDTAIIIAKGKRSPTLQTYHHAGAMFCMWSGMRYMSPPIWMFVFVNSAIHTLMYTYYTLSALSIRVPAPIKRSLTTMQIIQFLVGASYASLHSFISYDIPIRVLSKPVEAIKSAVPSAASSAVAEAVATGLAATVKKLLFRAAGEEGLAENVGGSGGFHGAVGTHGENPHPAHQASAVYHTEYVTIPCIDTSGQTFGIWLNVFYLAPLTVLFVRFFIRAYLRRTGQGKNAGHIDPKAIKGKGAENGTAALTGAGVDALKGLDRELTVNNGGILKEVQNSKRNGNANGKAH